MRTEVPCNENMFFPVRIDLQGVSCKPYREFPVSHTGFGFAVLSWGPVLSLFYTIFVIDISLKLNLIFSTKLFLKLTPKYSLKFSPIFLNFLVKPFIGNWNFTSIFPHISLGHYSYSFLKLVFFHLTAGKKNYYTLITNGRRHSYRFSLHFLYCNECVVKWFFLRSFKSRSKYQIKGAKNTAN